MLSINHKLAHEVALIGNGFSCSSGLSVALLPAAHAPQLKTTPIGRSIDRKQNLDGQITHPQRMGNGRPQESSVKQDKARWWVLGCVNCPRRQREPRRGITQPRINPRVETVFLLRRRRRAERLQQRQHLTRISSAFL